jgi:hypothetical protein
MPRNAIIHSGHEASSELALAVLFAVADRALRRNLWLGLPDLETRLLSRRRFRPQKFPAAIYASQLNSVEVNYTFRPCQRRNRHGWLDETPTDFRFSFKAPQRITHFNRLRDCDTLVAEFFDALEPVAAAGKLGLVLFQLPPNFKADAAALRTSSALRLPPANAPDRLRIPPPILVHRRDRRASCASATPPLHRRNRRPADPRGPHRRNPHLLPPAPRGGYEPHEISAFAQSASKP